MQGEVAHDLRLLYGQPVDVGFALWDANMAITLYHTQPHATRLRRQGKARVTIEPRLAVDHEGSATARKPRNSAQKCSFTRSVGSR